MTGVAYDPLKDFAPVALVTKVTEVLVVTPKLGIKTVKELVAMAKAKPGAVSFASTGIGSPPHLAQELLDVSAGVQFLHVPYRGAAPALTDLLGGQVQVLAADLPVLISQIQAGALIPIGAAADKRDAMLPDVPTLVEQGYPNTEASNWYALLAPAKTPPAVIAKLNKAVNDALNDPQVHEKLVKVRRHAGRRHAGSARRLHEVRIREVGQSRQRPRDQRHRAVMARLQLGRYSPVTGSGLSFGSALRSTGSTAERARMPSSSALTRCTSLAHQRTKVTAPNIPSVKASSGCKLTRITLAGHDLIRKPAPLFGISL